jgi:flagellar protein FlaG
MNISSATIPATPNVGATAPTHPPGSSQQGHSSGISTPHGKDDGALGYSQNEIGGPQGQIPGGAPAARGSDATANVQDPQKTGAADGKEQDKDQPKKEQVEQAVSSVNDYINKLRHRELQFSLDDDSGKMLIKIVDTDSKKVIRQIPPEEMLRIADNLGKDKGLLVEQKA